MSIKKGSLLDNLVNRVSGVLCPNCQKVTMSEEKYEATDCPCGVLHVSGGDEYLKFSVDAPFGLADCRVVAYPLNPLREEEEDEVEDEVEVDEGPPIDPLGDVGEDPEEEQKQVPPQINLETSTPESNGNESSSQSQ